MKPVRVAVWASDPIMRAGLTSTLLAHPDVACVRLDDLTDRDVLVVHLKRMTPQAVADLWANRTRAAVRKVLLVDELRESDVFVAAECQVSTMLPRKRTSGERIVEAVVSAGSAPALAHADLLGALLDDLRRQEREGSATCGRDAAGLTPLEVDVLKLTAEGCDTAEIAEKLCYSQRTVKNAVYALTNRLNLRNRPHAVAYAMRAGVI